MGREPDIYLGGETASDLRDICDALLLCPDAFPCPCLSGYIEFAFEKRSRKLRDPGP